MAQTQQRVEIPRQDAALTLYNSLLPEIRETWTAEKIDFIRRTCAPDASPQSFRTMMYKAWKYRLDPLNGEIYCYPIGGKDTIYTSQAGLLNIAHQTGKFGGIETEAIYDDKGKLTGAVGTAWRTDSDKPTRVTVRLSEYSTGKGLWDEKNGKPDTMIQKVSRCQVARFAFNISELYDRDELNNPAIAEQAARATGQQDVISVHAVEARDARAVDASTGEVLPNKPTRADLIAKVQRLVKDAELSGVNVPPEPDYAHALAKELIDYGLKVQALLDEQATFLTMKTTVQPAAVS